ncbi:hypothetical protein F5X99DRAFT_368784 [Biscogniauxia marginata]|nr:hypothetical protein F5X99DRAFT_368784 [Biscogniauxia marginata]
MNKLLVQPRNPLFLTCPPILASEYRDKLMGACVVNPYDPIHAYSSARGQKPIDTLPQIDPIPVEIDNYYNILNASSNAKVKVKFDQIISLFFERDGSSTEAREAASAKWWKMETPHDHFQDLMADSGYRDSVVALLRKNPKEPVYFVTNILALSTLKMDKAFQLSTKSGGHAGVRDPKTGISTQLDAEVGHSADRSAGGEFLHEMIVGLGVYEIYLTKQESWRWRAALKKRNSDHIIQSVPVPERTLHDLRMGSSLATPPDGARFLSKSNPNKDPSTPKSMDSTPAFELYFPE